MADPTIVEEVMKVVSIPVMAKARIGHYVEAKVLESLGVDYIDESEVLTPADEVFHINKREFTVPFVCGAKILVKLCAVSVKVHPCFVPKVSQERVTSLKLFVICV